MSLHCVNTTHCANGIFTSCVPMNGPASEHVPAGTVRLRTLDDNHLHVVMRYLEPTYVRDLGHGDILYKPRRTIVQVTIYSAASRGRASCGC